MSKPSKKTCRRCAKARPPEAFPINHPICASCLKRMARARIRARAAGPMRVRKRCAQCGESLSIAMFHWLPASGSHHSYCRPCHAAYMAERYRRLRRRRSG